MGFLLIAPLAVPSLDLVLLSVFHYGFRPRTAMIDHHPHFYPPGQLEDRFDQIALPILSTLAAAHDRAAVPDLVSISPGLWGLMRQGTEDDRNRKQAIEDGMSEDEAEERFDTWRTMPGETRRWNQQRMTEVLEHIGQAWPEASQRPRILWRTLHQIKPYRQCCPQLHE